MYKQIVTAVNNMSIEELCSYLAWCICLWNIVHMKIHGTVVSVRNRNFLNIVYILVWKLQYSAGNVSLTFYLLLLMFTWCCRCHSYKCRLPSASESGLESSKRVGSSGSPAESPNTSEIRLDIGYPDLTLSISNVNWLASFLVASHCVSVL